MPPMWVGRDMGLLMGLAGSVGGAASGWGGGGRVDIGHCYIIYLFIYLFVSFISLIYLFILFMSTIENK